MTEGTFPKNDGDILYASEVNNFYNRGRIFQFYSGPGITIESTSAETIGSIVLDLINPSGLSGANFSVISLNGYTYYSGTDPSYENKISYEIQAKESGGSFDIVLGSSDFVRTARNKVVAHKQIQSIDFIYPLTSKYYESGLQFMVRLFPLVGQAGTKCGFSGNYATVELR